MVFSFANHRFHKLSVEDTVSGSTQIVLTMWTDKNTVDLAIPGAHAHADFQPASQLSKEAAGKETDGEEADYYTIEPDLIDESLWLGAQARASGRCPSPGGAAETSTV
jgi:hypothetical protein